MLRQLASKKPGLLIAHASGYDTIAVRIAQQTGVPTITYDATKNLVKGKVGVITTSANQGGYLAGILAAKSTKSGTVGIVISASDTNWYLMSGGFAAGVRSVSKTIKIVFATIGPAAYDDAAGGKRVATSVIDAGRRRDLRHGRRRVARLHPGRRDRQEEDLVHRRHRQHRADRQEEDPALVRALELHGRLQAGDQRTSTAARSARRRTTSTSRTAASRCSRRSYAPASTWALVAKAQKGIIAGTVKVPLTTTKGAVDKLVKG